MISQQIEKRFNKNYTYIFMIKYPQEKIGIKGNSLTLIKDLNPKYTENITLSEGDQTLDSVYCLCLWVFWLMLM